MNTKAQVQKFIKENPEVFQPLWATTNDLGDSDWDAIEEKWGEVMLQPWDDDVYRLVQDEAYAFDWSQAQFGGDEDLGDTAPLSGPQSLEYDYPADDQAYDAERERRSSRRSSPWRD